MKLKYIALAIAAAAAGQAFAATTAPVTVGSIPAANFIYYTGASAPTRSNSTRARGRWRSSASR